MVRLTLVAPTVPQLHSGKVLNPAYNARLTALNSATRLLESDFNMTVLTSQMAGQLPTITIQFIPGGMSRVMNKMTGRHNHQDEKGTVVSGRFADVTLVWMVPK